MATLRPGTPVLQEDRTRFANVRSHFSLPAELSAPQLSRQETSSLQDKTDRTQDILQDILKTLQNSTIAEKGENDIRSMFWATYGQVAKEHDDEFLERSNSDMEIVLIFSGLFSAVNTAFIIAMQANPTNILLSQLVQNTSPNTVIPPITGLGTTATWFQGFAYVALSLSLLAAFGAVLGKQWLSYYKSIDVRGSLEERGKHRQQKLDGLEAWRFHAVLQSFPVLLQVSLLLFWLALSAFVWSQQGHLLAIAVVMPAAFGFFFYAFVVTTSLISPQCPFQTPISVLIRLLWRRVKTWYRNRTDERSSPNTGEETLSSPDTGEVEETPSEIAAMKWLFETSTDPEVISSVAWLLPTIKWTPESHMKTVCTRLLSAFETYFRGVQLSVSARYRALACGRALHHIICNNPMQKSKILKDLHFTSDRNAPKKWSCWHDIAYPWSFWDCKSSYDQYVSTRGTEHENRARIALRLAIMTSDPNFLKSTDVALIWDGTFNWTSDTRTAEDFDWLVDFLVHFHMQVGLSSGVQSTRNLDAMADALLALSAMRGLGSLAKRKNYFDSIIFSMEEDKPFRLRHAALRAAFDARLELVNIADNEEEEIRDQLLTELPSALLTATKIVAPAPSLDDPDAIFNPGREYCYLRLIYTLAKQHDWRARLEETGHVDRCIVLLDHVIQMNIHLGSWFWFVETPSHSYYLAGALIRMNPSHPYRGSVLADTIPELDWWKLLTAAWFAMGSNRLYREEESLEILPDIAKYTLECLEMQAAAYGLIRWVDQIYNGLKDVAAESHIVSAVKDVKDALDSKS